MPYFEDYVEGRIERFGAHEVTRDEVIEFASRYDPQPFHLDDEAAAANPIFGRLAASGWHTCAMVMRIMIDHWMQDGHFSLGGSGVDQLRWNKPVYPGDILSVEAEVLSKVAPQSRPGMGFVDFRISVSNQKDEVVMVMKVSTIQKRRPD